MKKALLIFLLLVLPWQAIASMERNLAHVLGNGSEHGSEFVIEHMAEHDAHVLHHHDADDGNPHVDNSDKSVQHLADYEQGGSVNILLPALSHSSAAAVTRVPPAVWPDTFRTRTIIPLLRPPRLPA